MQVRLIDSLATTEPLAEVFSDRSMLQAMLDFEMALSRVEARLKIIPQAAAELIATEANPDAFDIGALTRDTLRAGTPGRAPIQSVKLTTERLGRIQWQYLRKARRSTPAKPQG